MDQMTQRWRTARQPRRLHLIDLANLSLRPGAAQANTALAVYRTLIVVAARDHVVIAAPRSLAFDAKRAWPQARVVIRGRSIARLLTDDFAPSRYWALYGAAVVGSGDGSFAPWVSSVGIPVTVVTHQHRLSRELLGAAHAVVTLGSPVVRGGARPDHAPLSPPPARHRRSHIRPRDRADARPGVPC